MQLSEYYTNLHRGKYYEGAILHIKSKLKKPYIFIFSNHIEWRERIFFGDAKQ
ncbi:hypothetical protein ACWIWK_06280 [Helicobacter sp. 23-1048]